MKNLKRIFVLMISAIGLSSCDNESVVFETDFDTDSVITNIIDDFRSSVDISSRSATDFQVISVDTRYYKIETDTVIESLPTKELW